jgi:hypothetical protein
MNSVQQAAKKAGSHKSLQHKADPYDEYPFCSLFTIFKFFGVFFWPFASVLRDLMDQELKDLGITIFRPCCADGRTFTGSKMTKRLLSCEQRMYSAVTSYLVEHGYEARAIVREQARLKLCAVSDSTLRSEISSKRRACRMHVQLGQRQLWARCSVTTVFGSGTGKDLRRSPSPQPQAAIAWPQRTAHASEVRSPAPQGTKERFPRC